MVLIVDKMKNMDMPSLAGLIAIGLLTWNVSTTQKLAVDIAAFKADMISRVIRLEYMTKQIDNYQREIKK